MRKVKVVYEPLKLLGRSIKVFLIAGGEFNFKVTSVGVDYINGYDDESVDIHINIKDIDFILE